MGENKEEKNVESVKMENGKAEEKKAGGTKQKDNEKVVKKEQTPKKAQESNSKVKKTEGKEEDPTKFRKVEMKDKFIEFDAKKGKSSHKFIKAILIIIMLLIAAYCMFFCRNLIILSNLKELASQYTNISNYSYESISNSKKHLKYSKKDNVSRLELEHDEDPDTNMIVWQDKDKNEQIIAFPAHNAAIESNDKMMDLVCRLPFTLADMGSLTDGLALYSLIYTDTLNNKECYVIQVGLNLKMWIEKDTGLLYREDFGENMYSEITKLEINNVDEIYKPDLTGYKINTSDAVTENVEQ